MDEGLFDVTLNIFNVNSIYKYAYYVQDFINNVQGDPKSAKSFPFYKSNIFLSIFLTNFLNSIKLDCRIKAVCPHVGLGPTREEPSVSGGGVFKYFIYINNVLKRAG